MTYNTYTHSGFMASTQPAQLANEMYDEYSKLGQHWELPMSGDKTTLDIAGCAHELHKHS